MDVGSAPYPKNEGAHLTKTRPESGQFRIEKRGKRGIMQGKERRPPELGLFGRVLRTVRRISTNRVRV